MVEMAEPPVDASTTPERSMCGSLILMMWSHSSGVKKFSICAMVPVRGERREEGGGWSGGVAASAVPCAP